MTLQRMDPPDVTVIGAGIVGAACARALAEHQSVVLVDSGGEAGIATPAAAGMLAPLVETRHEDPMLSLSVRARDFYHELAPDLLETTGVDVGLWTEGILQLAYTDADVHRLKSEIAWQRQQGFNSDWLDDEELKERSPGISPEAVGAMLAPEDGALEPQSLHQAFIVDAERRGTWVTRGTRVDEILIDAGSVTGVRMGQETMATGAVVIAAGCWSGRIGGLPRPLSVEPIRGQMASLDWPDNEPPGIVYGGSGYVVHRRLQALAGSTMEHAGFDAVTTEEGLARVYGTMRRIYPALDPEGVNRTWAGLRPVSPDGRPLVGPDPDVAGLWYATGHGRNGILLAGLTGELIARLCNADPVEYDINPIDPARFWRL